MDFRGREGRRGKDDNVLLCCCPGAVGMVWVPWRVFGGYGRACLVMALSL